MRHHDPPEVAWLLPELELGELPELKPLEPELVELEPEFVLVFVELEPELVFVELEPELVLVEPEPELLADEPAEVDPVDPVEDDALVLCVDPGRARASAPAVTTLAMVTAVVADRTLARPFSLAAMARRIASRCALLM